MQKLIEQKLKELEQQQNIRILRAVESGSRAWGFPSPDSDYDVRFFYIRPREDYLKLEKTRDTIELPTNDLLDINGWDLKKALQLLHGANPTLFEWMASPIVYLDTDFSEALRPLTEAYFSPLKSFWHYHSTAERHRQAYLKGDTVKAKKYFYMLRPLLACKWVLEKQTPPPMLFRDLVDAELEPALRPVVEHLLDLKINAPEVKVIPRVEEIDRYLDENLAAFKERAASFPEGREADWEPLNTFFLKMLAE